jgi:valyl-tRNA synthetase
MNVPPSKRPRITIVSDSPEAFEQGRAYIARLAGASEITISASAPDDTSGLVAAATDGAVLYMPLDQLVDMDAERARLERELEKARADLERAQAKLRNNDFITKARESVVEAERAKAGRQRALIANLEESLHPLRK